MPIGITLGSLHDGAVGEKFTRALQDVVMNCCDPNTDATTKRKLTIELTFTPNKQDRMDYGLVAKVSTKLGSTKPLQSTVTMAFDHETGEIAAYEHVPAQPSLFDTSAQIMKKLRESPEAIEGFKNH